jgi:hypothetical protein
VRQAALVLPAFLVDNGSAASRDDVSAKLGDDAYVAARQGAARGARAAKGRGRAGNQAAW